MTIAEDKNLVELQNSLSNLLSNPLISESYAICKDVEHGVHRLVEIARELNIEDRLNRRSKSCISSLSVMLKMILDAGLPTCTVKNKSSGCEYKRHSTTASDVIFKTILEQYRAD